MRPAIAFAAGVLALSLIQPAAAQTFKLNPDLFGQKKPAPNPPKVDWDVRTALEQAQAARPAVICGMTVIPADPKIDPKMAVKPKDTGTKYTLKMVEPTTCKAP